MLVDVCKSRVYVGGVVLILGWEVSGGERRGV